MKIILLSLDNDIGKKRRSLINYEYELFYGYCKLEDIPVEFINKMYKMYNISEKLFKAKVCHFYSYYMMLKKIVDEKLDNVIICEDDAILKDKLPRSFNTDEILILNCELHHPTSWKKNTKQYFNDNIFRIKK